MTITLLHGELLHDIETIVATIADGLGKDPQNHTSHLIADVGADDATDRRRRLMSLAASLVAEALAPLGCSLADDDNDDYIDLATPSAAYCYTLDADNIPTPAKALIARLAHEYIVAYVIYRWMLIVAPELAPIYKAQADDAMLAMKKAVTRRDSPLRRGHTPV